MTKFILKKSFKIRFEKFLSSNLFNDQSDHAKTAYWKYHSKKINYTIKESILSLEGESGNYIPHKRNSFKFFLKALKIFVKKVVGVEKSNKLSYKEAFSKVMKDARIAGFQQVHIDKNKILAKNISDCKKIFPFDYEINDHIIKSYYLINILNSYIDLSKTEFIIDIGAGNGNLISLLKHHFQTKCIVDIDLPETLILCIPFLNNLFPDAKIILPNEINDQIDENTLLNHDFIFLTPSQVTFLKENLIDLFININSFGEMNMLQINEYLNLIQKAGKNDSFFFNSNRVEKIPFAGKKDPNIKPIRFFEYPFFKNEILFFEICRFISLVQTDPIYLKLEKIKK